MAPAPVPSGPLDAITDVPGIKVGHWTDRRRATGCTVILAPQGASPGYTNPGGAPGTIDTDLLRPENRIPLVHAVLLSGGSAYGLEAAAGVRAQLRDDGIGFRMGEDIALMPIVVGAIVFDLGLGSGSAHPTIESGRRAVRRAKGGRVEQGSVGVGAGCTVGKLGARDRWIKSGVGTASVRHPSGLVVGAIVAANAVGDVYDPDTGELLAAPRGNRRGSMTPANELLLQKPLQDYLAEAEQMRRTQAGIADVPTNTTIGCVATNARLTKAEATRLAIMANDGLSASIRPAHTPADGDTIFALATGELDLPVDQTPNLLTLLGSMAATAVGRAIVNGIHSATGLAGVPSAREWRSRPRRSRPRTG